MGSKRCPKWEKTRALIPNEIRVASCGEAQDVTVIYKASTWEKTWALVTSEIRVASCGEAHDVTVIYKAQT